MRNRIKDVKDPLVEAWMIRLSQGEMVRSRLLPSKGRERHQGCSSTHVTCAKARQGCGCSGESCCGEAEGSKAGQVMWTHVGKVLGKGATFRLDIIGNFCLGKRVGTLKGWE